MSVGLGWVLLACETNEWDSLMPSRTQPCGCSAQHKPIPPPMHYTRLKEDNNSRREWGAVLPRVRCCERVHCAVCARTWAALPAAPILVRPWFRPRRPCVPCGPHVVLLQPWDGCQGFRQPSRARRHGACSRTANGRYSGGGVKSNAATVTRKGSRKAAVTRTRTGGSGLCLIPPVH